MLSGLGGYTYFTEKGIQYSAEADKPVDEYQVNIIVTTLAGLADRWTVYFEGKKLTGEAEMVQSLVNSFDKKQRG